MINPNRPQKPVFILVTFIAFIAGFIVSYVVFVPQTIAPTPENPSADDVVFVELPFDTVAEGVGGAMAETKNTVIRTQQEWEDLWSRLHENKSSEPALPEIDFSRFVVIGAFAGEKPTGGYATRIVRVLEKEDKIEIVIKETDPTPDAIVTQAITNPYHIVKIAKTERDIEFATFE